MAQGNGLYSLVDAAADTFSDFWARCLCLPGRSGTTGASTGGLTGHLTKQ